MPKGLFTQGAAVLLNTAATLDELLPLLGEFKPIWRGGGSSSWQIGGESLVFPFRPEVNGKVSIDIVPHPWPDSMGDPKTDGILFGAWSMGHFGPFAFPGNLERAIQQSWSWPHAKVVAGSHRAFVRIRTSYIFGAGPELKCIPPDYNAVDESSFLLRVVMALLRHASAICYFNPNGEILLDRPGLENAVRHSIAESRPPLDALANVRLFNVNEQWLLMDSVGMAQLDTLDLEACFCRTCCHPDDVGNFIRNLSLYLLEKGPVIEDGNTVDGPGGVHWRAQRYEKQISSPTRPVLRLLPMDGSKPPGPIEWE